MRINTNVASLTGQKNLFETQRNVDSSMAKLSSGLRISRAADDAAGLSIANKLRSSTRGLQQASNNAQQANAMLQIAEGSATTIQKILERQNELYVQSQSTGNNSGVSATLSAEFTTLSAEIGRILESTNYQGTAILGQNLTFQVADGSAGGSISVSVALTTSSVSVGSIGSVSTQLDAVNTALASIGAAQNRLDYTVSNIKTAIVNQSAAESVIRDVDMAEEMSKFSKNNILAQAGTSMLAQANQSGQGVLSLLR
jgi:flagellin